MKDTRANASPAAHSGTGMPPVMPAASPNRWWWVWVGAALLLIALVAFLFRFNPAQHSFYPFCVFHRMTGLECPGCGGLRATHQLLHGHIVTAFRYNPLVVTAAPIVLLLAVRRWLRGPGRPLSPRTAVVWTWVVFAVVLIFWILRNLPIELFKLPAG